MLYSKNLKLSSKSTRIQKNFMFSLVVAMLIHTVLLFIPMVYYFVVQLVVSNWQSLSKIIVLMVQDHGSISTLSMIFTNYVLRNGVKEVWKCGKEGRISGVHVIN
ncbi:hypothetical protein CAEBREN_30485 [Caenorhabditis brenneri]|uniref:Uncharacterized protein n=1 Tax=Caenorhabditis brenneri TaxID=135651 RepID=G0PDI0_CAEBE|nr:hypothetical protein CAEBREN_30485 [Caenorhabditis brenneri]